ncbi:P2X purinoceptor 3-like [Astyanax mexicanus]|uniref:P2X purinoceptor 3-like n=1 Tax=Astyanax mexicanus TaxID=7994 RepID=UPI0020CB5600|nr:P2X purinoceptor 3-like [Astyanax mexicanus]
MWNCVTEFFTYDTTKSVVVKSWTIGIINRIVQLLIISYFGWVFLYEKAYQERDTAIESSVMTKVRGFGEHQHKIMDVADYVTPTHGGSEFCIITKLITTEKQVQGKCPESESKFKCEHNDNCTKLMSRPALNCLLTGKCVQFHSSTSEKYCEIRGWCPADTDDIPIKPMMEVENFTILIKNSIRFPRYNFTKGNFLPTINSSYVKKCNFDFEKNTYCPIFKVGDVVRLAHQNFTTLVNKGGMIGIKISWVCDLDKSEDECEPAYFFTRLDITSEKSSVLSSYSFRFAKYFKMADGTEFRTLLKAYAIRFNVIVTGNAGKSRMIPALFYMVLLIFVGAVLWDKILLNFLKLAKKSEEVSDAHE